MKINMLRYRDNLIQNNIFSMCLTGAISKLCASLVFPMKRSPMSYPHDAWSASTLPISLEGMNLTRVQAMKFRVEGTESQN